jgi:hypothetical protein
MSNCGRFLTQFGPQKGKINCLTNEWPYPSFPKLIPHIFSSHLKINEMNGFLPFKVQNWLFYLHPRVSEFCVMDGWLIRPTVPSPL